MNRKLIGVALLLTAIFSNPVGAAPWATVGGYYPGMSKEAAKKVGLKECKEEYGRVQCSPTGNVSLRSIASKDTSIYFNGAGSAVEKITLRFPSAEITDQQLQSAAESTFGTGHQYSDGNSNCLRDFEWLREDDERVHLCIATGSKKWKSHYVELMWEPGLGKRLAKNKKNEQEKQKKLKGFNTY